MYVGLPAGCGDAIIVDGGSDMIATSPKSVLGDLRLRAGVAR
jgi:hypothetical protein